MRNLKITFLLFVIYLLQSSGHTQNWQTIKPIGEFIFSTGNNYQPYSAYRIDTLQPVNIIDTIYKSYYVIKRVDFSCYSDTMGSWIGKQVIIKPNGWNIFINYNNDSIRINTLAMPGQLWPVCSEGNVSANVVSIKDTLILGLQDSIKIIVFSSTIPEVNGQKIILSKHYGLVSVPDLYSFPNDPWSYNLKYSLAGMSSPKAGIQNPRLRDVYTFDVGDEFHIYTLYNPFDYNWYPEYESWATLKVIDTLAAINSDTLKYKLKRCYTEKYSHLVDTIIQIEYTKSNDTTTVALFLNNSFETEFNHLPDEPYYTNDGLTSNSLRVHASGIIGKVTPSYYNTLFNNFSCWNYLNVDGCIINPIFYPGILSSYYDAWYIDCRNKSTLIYFKKGNQTWGIPFSCDSILAMGNSEVPRENFISITPNPAYGYFTINTNDQNAKHYLFEMFDLFGNLLFQTKVIGNKTVINCRNFPKGMCFYRLTDDSGKTQSGKIIIQ
ncbi:MAG TPA: T9SS type A sorting domain-containing protein [Bacteroidales bacterium]|nr:T9SS type A sorting domain-containing protein [Bacteroidales bacterium]